jgi:hypothetical protein
VADLASELAGREILIPPNSPSDGVRVAFIVENGAPIELLEFTDPNHPGRRQQSKMLIVGNKRAPKRPIRTEFRRNQLRVVK